MESLIEAPFSSFGGAGTATSADGSLVVGFVGGNADFFDVEAFRWTPQSGYRLLRPLPPAGRGSVALDVSADGTVIVGTTGSTGSGYGPEDAFVWTEAHGMQQLQALLEAEGIDLSGWQLREATAISADGRTIVGWGRNPSHLPQAFVATLPRPLRLSATIDGTDGTSTIDLVNDTGKGFATCELSATIHYLPGCETCAAPPSREVPLLLADPSGTGQVPPSPLLTPSLAPGDTVSAMAHLPLVNDREIRLDVEAQCETLAGTTTTESGGASGKCTDSDNDALCDFWEIAGGVDLNGDGRVDSVALGTPKRADFVFPTTPTGYSTDRPSIILEIDLIPGYGGVPKATDTLAQGAFTKVGIDLHIDRDEKIADPGNGEIVFCNQSDAPSDFDYLKLQHPKSSGALEGFFGTKEERSAANAEELRDVREFVVRYAIFANKLNPVDVAAACPGTSPVGVAEPFGDDLAVLIGPLNNLDKLRDIEPTAFLKSAQFAFAAALAGTLVHELGHTLGLKHGGDDDRPYKPNYISIMNYARLFEGLQPERRIQFSRWEMEPLNLLGGVDEHLGLAIKGAGTPLPSTVARQICGSASCPLSFSVEDGLFPGRPDEDSGTAGSAIDWDGNGSVESFNGPNSALDLPWCSSSLLVLGCTNQCAIDRAVELRIQAASPGDVPSFNDQPALLSAVKRRDSERFGSTSGVGKCSSALVPELPVEPIVAQIAVADSDGDGHLNPDDNCPGVYNPDQKDSGGTAHGDACQPPPGDFDLDRDVDLDDAEFVTDAFGLTASDGEFYSAVDLDADGAITFVDYQLWVEAYEDFQTGQPVTTTSSGTSRSRCGLGGVELTPLMVVYALARCRRRS